MVKYHKHRAPKKAVKDPGLVFSAKDFAHHPKNHFWYIGIGLLGLAGMVILFRSGEYLLMAVVLALVVALYRLAPIEPEHKQIRLTHRGMYWGDNFFPYFKLRSFWIAEARGATTVYVERLNVAPTIHFVIPDQRTDEVVEFLTNYLPWHDHKDEPLADRLSRFLRF